jgi:hypothetical protein
MREREREKEKRKKGNLNVPPVAHVFQAWSPG